MLQHSIDVGGTILAWAVVLFRLNEVLKGNRRILKAWSFAFAFALFGTFQIDTVYLAFDVLVGLNNLSWLLSYVFGTLSIHCLCATCCNKMPRWAWLYLTTTLVLMTAAFPFGPNRTLERVEHIIPYNVAELLFMGTYYIYAAIMITLIPIRAVLQAYHNERDLTLRLRSLVGLSAAGTVLAYFVTEFTIFLLTFIVPPLRPSAHNANAVANIPLLAFAVLWPLLFAPNRIYIVPTRFIRFLDKILTLTQLRALRVRLDRLCSTRSSNQGWLDQLRTPDFYICQEVIKILDDIRILVASKDTLQGDDPALNLALRLDLALQDANPSSDPATAYWELSQLLRRAA